MTTRKTQRDFDALSSVYDETREPIAPETLDGLFQFLQEHRWRTLLEVGVGTGRVSSPLVARGWKVVGVDVSRGMLAHAGGKGLPYLVQGTAYRLPFADRTFDAVLFVHVLHILDDPGAGLREAARVSRGGALAIMDRAPEEPSADRAEEVSPRDVLRGVLTEVGYPELLGGGPRVKEREIVRAFPPEEVRLVSDREVTEPLARQLDTLEKRAYRHVLDMPPEVLERAVSAARARVGDRTLTYRRRESLVWWPSSLTPGR